MSDPQQPPVPSHGGIPPQSPADPGTPPPHLAQPPYAGPGATAPQEPAQPHGYYVPGGAVPQPGYPAPAPRRAANTQGRLGLVFGIIGLALGVVSGLVSRILVYTSGYRLFEALTWVQGLLSLTLGVLALVFGIAGLRRQDVPRGQAGIATGIGIAILVSTLSTLAVTAITPLFAWLYY